MKDLTALIALIFFALHEGSTSSYEKCIISHENRRFVILCNKQGLLEIPSEHPPHLEKFELLNFEGNKISYIRKQDLVEFSNLLALHFENNHVRHIYPGAFQSMKKLKFLSLANNQVPTPFKGTFRGLISLTHLYLRGNRISHVEMEAFHDLVKLENLDLGSNEIKAIHLGAFERLNKLKVLMLDKNQIRILPSGVFQGLSRLYFLNLRDNKLRWIKNDTFLGATAITALVLDGNELAGIHPDGINYLKHLDTLTLKDQRSRGLLDLKFEMFSSFIKYYSAGKPPFFDIDNNSFQCTCKMSWLVYFMNRGILPNGKGMPPLLCLLNSKNVTCYGEDIYKESHLVSLMTHCCDDEYKRFDVNSPVACVDY